MIFLSYAHEDSAIARKIYTDLRTIGYDVWIDEESLVGGLRWETEIRKAIADCKCFMVLLSSSSVDRKAFVHKEVRQAFEVLDEYPDNDFLLLSIRLDSCDPSHERLKKFQWVDLFPEYESGFRKIRSALHSFYYSSDSQSNGDSNSSSISVNDELQDQYTMPVPVLAGSGPEDGSYEGRWNEYFKAWGTRRKILRFTGTIADMTYYARARYLTLENESGKRKNFYFYRFPQLNIAVSVGDKLTVIFLSRDYYTRNDYDWDYYISVYNHTDENEYYNGKALYYFIRTEPFPRKKTFHMLSFFFILPVLIFVTLFPDSDFTFSKALFKLQEEKEAGLILVIFGNLYPLLLTLYYKLKAKFFRYSRIYIQIMESVTIQ